MEQDTKEIIQFKHIDHEQVAEKQQAALRAKFEEYLAKQKTACKKRTTLHGAFGGEEHQKRVQSISEYQTEVEIELDVEEEKAAEIKNQVQTAKNSPEAQQHRAATASEEVAEMQQELRDSVKVQAAETQELTRTQHEDGKQDAWNGHAQVASQAMAAPEEYGPDAERQEVKRDEQEFRTAQQQVKKTTLGRARREREERDHQRVRV